MDRGSSVLMDLEKAVDNYMTTHRPRYWGEESFYKLDWTSVESVVMNQPVYKLSRQGYMHSSRREFSEEFVNATSVEQKFEMNQTHQVHNRCSVQVLEGILPGAAPLKLRMPPEMAGSGVPSDIYLLGTESPAGEHITWSNKSSVTVPARSKVHASFSGDEQRFDGTFEQLIQLQGHVVVRIYSADAVYRQSVEIGLDELVRKSGSSLHGMKFVKNGVQLQLRGSCSFIVSVNNKVTVKQM